MILFIGLKNLLYCFAISLSISYKCIYFRIHICQVDRHYYCVTKRVMTVGCVLFKFLKVLYESVN